MAVDELKLLVNRLRRLQESDDPNINKIDELRDKISSILSESKVKVKVKCSYEFEVHMNQFDEYDWIISRLVNDPTLTQEEILIDDIRNDVDDYIDLVDMNVIIEDENGKELDNFSQIY